MTKEIIMKILITLISSLLLMIQMPIQAEEGHSEPITMSIADLNILINNYKSALEKEDADEMLLDANKLLDTYKNTNDFDVKKIIINALLITDESEQYTFLIHAPKTGKSGIIKKTIDTLQDSPEKLQELLIAQDYSYGETFLHVASREMIKNDFESVINIFSDQEDMYQNLLIKNDYSENTFFHTAVVNDRSDILQTIIGA